MQTSRIEVNGVSLNVAMEGDASHSLVIFLHGFPETHAAWKKQLSYFSPHYFCVAPDLRGYGLSDKPSSIKDYTFDKIAGDILALIDHFGKQRAIIVGHDWGAAITWYLAENHPAKIEKIVVINVPHPLILQRELKKSLKQVLNSWYIFYFQIPVIPEKLNRLSNFAWLRYELQRSSKPGTFSEELFAEYCQAWSQPGALRSMINYYRAFLRKPPTVNASPKITAPTLVIWGAQDNYLNQSMAQPSADLCEHGQLALFNDATHWVQHEKTDAVNRLIAAHLADTLDAKTIESEVSLSEKKNSRQTAYVLGGGVAGLLAAKALSNCYERVIILERDAIDRSQVTYRKGTAQAKHAHVLLKRGLDEIENLIPGFTRKIVQQGGQQLDASYDWRCLFPRGWFPQYQSGMEVICASRSLIEFVIRESVLEKSNITLRDGVSIEKVEFSAAKAPRLYLRLSDNTTEQLDTDCVVNSLGRNAATDVWLQTSGFPTAKTETIMSYLGYSTCIYKNINLPTQVRASLIMAKDPDFNSGGIIYPIENDQHLVTLYGLGKNYPPADDQGFLAFAKNLRSDLIYQSIVAAESVSPINQFVKNENLFHHYGIGRKWPRGFLVLGDALCSPNPVYGQGMTSAAISASVLQRGLQKEKIDIARIQRKITRNYSLAWLNAKNEDLRWATTNGQVASPIILAMHRFMNRLLWVASSDKKVNLAFLRVLHMTSSPLSLLNPVILFKLLVAKKQSEVDADDEKKHAEKMRRTG